MLTPAFIVVGLCVLAFLLLLYSIGKMFRKAAPNQAIIVYGFRKPRVIKSGAAVIFPVVETYRELTLELMSFDVAPQQDLYTRQGVAVTVEAVAQIKVRSDNESILTAAEQFLSKTPDQREGLIRLVMEGHLRGIIGQLTVEQIVKEPEMVAERMRSTCMDDMSKMGLEVVSFTIREVRDKNEYITSMGRPDIARIRRDADIASAEAERDTAIRRANALREAAIAKEVAPAPRRRENTRPVDQGQAWHNSLPPKIAFPICGGAGGRGTRAATGAGGGSSSSRSGRRRATRIVSPISSLERRGRMSRRRRGRDGRRSIVGSSSCFRAARMSSIAANAPVAESRNSGSFGTARRSDAQSARNSRFCSVVKNGSRATCAG